MEKLLSEIKKINKYVESQSEEFKAELAFQFWFNQPENADLQTRVASGLTFVKKLNSDEWIELIHYIFKKCKEVKK